MGFLHKSLGYKFGLSIAFIGQDGAGKSTITEHICKWLNWKIEARKFYLGSGDHYHSIFKTIKKVLNCNNHFAKVIWSLLNILDLAYLSIHNRRIVINAHKYTIKGGIALFDRYPQNQVSGINDGPKIRTNYSNKIKNRFLKGIINTLAKVEEKNISIMLDYSPDVVIKLILPPEESIKRKPEENLKNVIEKHDIIKKLVFPNSKIYNIDATMHYDDEILLIKNIIWTEIQTKSIMISEEIRNA